MPTWVRATADTMPWVTVWPTPNGLPMRQHHVADLKGVGIAEIDRRKSLVGVLDAQHREIGALVLEHDLGLELALVGERDLDLVGILDDVVIGHDEPGGIDDHAGAERALDLLARAAQPAAAEEAAEDRVVEHRHAIFDHPGRIDVDDRRATRFTTGA